MARQKIYRENDGDDARYSFLPGRAADDPRLKLVHFRVLAFLGRRNQNYGWWELNQGSLAKRFGVVRQTINSAISELVEWKYAATRPQVDSSFLQYRTADWDRTAEVGVSPPDDMGGCRLQMTPLSAPKRQSCRVEATPHFIEKTMRPLDLSPLPPRGGRGRDAAQA